MSLTKIENTIKNITPVDKGLEQAATEHLDNLTKPRGSLGRVEDLARFIYAIQGSDTLSVDPARVYTIAGDHGIAAHGVSLYPQEVTRQMVLNFLNKGAAISVLANTAGAELRVVDAGCVGDDFPAHPELIRAKVAPGTANMLEGPAMTMKQCAQAVNLGMELARHASYEGIKTLLTGEMGIGNTTPATALYCAYLNLAPSYITGPGTGLDAHGLDNKVRVIEQCLAMHAGVISKADPVEILASLGGFEIAALAGLILGAAAQKTMVIVDGFISTAAYAAAWKICPQVQDYCVLSHVSAEPGHKLAAREMGLSPILDLGLRLGEGTGAALCLPILRAAADIYNDMATFGQANVSDK